MARFTLSITDEVAAQLDAFAAHNSLNRSQAAEHIFTTFFQVPDAQGEQETEETDETGESSDYLQEQLLEMRDYLTILYSRHESLRNYVITSVDYSSTSSPLPKTLPRPSWADE